MAPSRGRQTEASSVSVVIPARDDAAGLPAAVRSCLDQRPVGVDEVVIAVGPSADGTGTVARQLADHDDRVRVVINDKGATPAGLNAAIAATTGTVIVRVDAHCVLPPTYVADALDTMEATGAANVGAIQRPVGTSTVQRGIAAALTTPAGGGGAAYRSATHTRRADTGYLGVFRRDALDAVGGYAPDFVRNQDAELNERLRRAGYEVWVDPRLVVDYTPRSSFGALSRQYWQYGWWRARTARKHPGSLRARQLLPPLAVLAALIGLVAGRRRRPALLAPLGYAAVIAQQAATADAPPAERAIAAAALPTMHASWSAGFLASSLSSRLSPVVQP